MRIRDENLDGTRHYRMHGESLAEVQDWIRKEPKRWSTTASRTNSPSQSWDLGVGYDGAMRLAEHGWSEGAKDLSDRLEAHLPSLDKTDTWRYDVAGERPDIGRHLSGDPASMMRHGHPKGHKPILSLAVNIRVSCVVKAAAMANFGAAMVATIDKLEHVGRRVELVSAFSSRVRMLDRVTGSWIVKRAEDPLDLAAVAFSIAHPAASRRIGFAMFERSAVPQCSAYGYDLVMGENDMVDPLPGTLFLEGLRNNTNRCHTLSDAVLFVRDQINKAAGEDLVTVEG
jgi:hypothetical protein